MIFHKKAENNNKMTFIKLTWKYLLASVGIVIIAVILSLLLEWDNKPEWVKELGDGWIKALIVISYITGIILPIIGGMVAANKIAPRLKSINQKFALYRTIRHVIAWILGFVVGVLLNGGLHPYEWTDRVRRIWLGWFLFC